MLLYEATSFAARTGPRTHPGQGSEGAQEASRVLDVLDDLHRADHVELLALLDELLGCRTPVRELRLPREASLDGVRFGNGDIGDRGIEPDRCRPKSREHLCQCRVTNERLRIRHGS